MIRQRHERYVEYLVTRGKGRDGMTSEEQAESDRRIREVEAAVMKKSEATSLFRSYTLFTDKYISAASVRDENPEAEDQNDKGKGKKAMNQRKAQNKGSKIEKGKGNEKTEKGKGKGKE